MGVTSPYQSHWQDVWACAWAVNNATEKTNVLKASPVNLLLGIVFFMVSPHFADKNSGWLIVIIQGSGSDRVTPPDSTPVRIDAEASDYVSEQGSMRSGSRAMGQGVE